MAQLAAADAGPAPALQALIYPVTDYSAEPPLLRALRRGLLPHPRGDGLVPRQLLRRPPTTARDPRASPILATDLGGLAPAHVVTAGFDPLRDEGEDYAARLRAAGVPTTLRRESDLVHGFVNAVGLGGRAREAMIEIAAAVRAGLTAATLSAPPG